MDSDADYASFLDKANQDTGTNTAPKGESVTTKASNTDIPQVLQEVEQYYVSEADEPFEPVSLNWDGKSLPSEDDFAGLTGHSGEVSIVSMKEFDPQDRYNDVTAAVNEAGGHDVKVYRLHISKTRAEYYVIALNSKASKIVGMKAKAVET
ncbi:MAG: hypothetical protein M1812_004188 [Candelaria pacifica]|nr:MAG: hypothetical protein M1812_004188 [Candelaria pacifica]